MSERTDPDREPAEDGGGETPDEMELAAPGDGPAPAPRLAPRQLALISALVCNPDLQAACKAAGVSRTTAYRWLKHPAFGEELARQRDAVLTEALAAVKTHATQAVTELATLLTAKDERLRRLVCNDILAHALRVRELEDIERRLLILEKRMEEQTKRRTA
jgi:hypothetical protein